MRMAEQLTLTPDLARAARALTQVSCKYIAGRAGLTRDEVRGFERYQHTLTDEEKDRLQTALEGFGVVFVNEDAVGGVGVRKKFTSVTSKRIEKWEGEGGPAAEDG